MQLNYTKNSYSNKKGILMLYYKNFSYWSVLTAWVAKTKKSYLEPEMLILP